MPDTTPAKVTVTVPVTFTVDVSEWAIDYGISEAEAVTDIREAFRTGAVPGESGRSMLADAIARGWPSIGSLATITAAQPYEPDTDDDGKPCCGQCGHAEGDTDVRGTRVVLVPQDGICESCVAYNVSRCS